jgi:hypothetical protein
MSERERLADLVERQKKMEQDIANARRALRERYARLVPELPVETFSEREFRQIVEEAARVGGPAAAAALKALSPPK